MFVLPAETLDDLVRAMVLGRPAELPIEVLRGGARRSLTIRPRPAEARVAA